MTSFTVTRETVAFYRGFFAWELREGVAVRVHAKQFVECALFLGLGSGEILEMLDTPSFSPLRAEVIRTAFKLGYDASDFTYES